MWGVLCAGAGVGSKGKVLPKSTDFIFFDVCVTQISTPPTAADSFGFVTLRSLGLLQKPI